MKQLRSSLHYIPPLLLAAAITFSDRTFTLGSIDPSWARQAVIRLEDIIIVLLAIGVASTFLLTPLGKINKFVFPSAAADSKINKFVFPLRFKIKKPPLFPILPLWIVFELVSSLINAIGGYLVPLRILFYTLKVSEYAFIFYYIFAFIKTPRDLKVLMQGWMVFIWIHLAYIAYQFIYPAHGGIWLIGESGNFNIGGQFLVLALYALSYFLFFVLPQPRSSLKKASLGFLFLVPLIGIFTAGIKAGAVAGIVGSGLLLIAYLIKAPAGHTLKRVGTLGASIALILFLLTAATKHLPYDFIQSRTLNFPSYFVSLNFRAGIWKDHLQGLSQSPLQILIGRGGADPYAEASHNQYVRNLSAGGLAGSLVFLILIALILRNAFLAYWKGTQPLVVAFAAGLFASTIAMLIIGFSGESFLIVRPAEHFWYFAGMAFAAMYFENHKNTHHLAS